MERKCGYTKYELNHITAEQRNIWACGSKTRSLSCQTLHGHKLGILPETPLRFHPKRLTPCDQLSCKLPPLNILGNQSSTQWTQHEELIME